MSKLDHLTPRERQIALQIAQGLKAAQITERLGITKRNYYGIRNRLMDKLGALCTADLVRMVTADAIAKSQALIDQHRDRAW